MKRSAQKMNILRRVLALLSALILLPLPVRAAAGVDVGCYAAVNGSWRLVETVRVTETSDIFGTSRYFIGADELQRVYADYGFAAADLASEDDPLVGKRYFAHTVEGDLSQIWADTLPRRESADGELLIPLGDSKKQLHTYLYYLPKTRSPVPLTSRKKSRSAMRSCLRTTAFIHWRSPTRAGSSMKRARCRRRKFTGRERK